MSLSHTGELKKAEQLLNQGNIAAALEEYGKLVLAHPSDLLLAEQVGDIFASLGQNEEAIHHYFKVGKDYAKNGFTLKAIAVLKKANKLSTTNPDLLFYLAELYSQQGFLVDARKFYAEATEAFTRSGQTRQALEALNKIADLDPENVSVRLKLAESYLRLKLNQQAHDAFLTAGKQFLRIGQFKESQQAFMRALSIDLRSKEALSSLAGVFIQQGELPKAIAMFSRVLANNPEDPALLSLVGSTYLHFDLLDEAEQIFLKLFEVEPTSFENLLKLGHRYLAIEQFDRAISLVNSCIEALIAQGQPERALEILGPITGADPYHLGAFLCLKKIYSQTNDTQNLITALNGLVEAALFHQDQSLAIDALRQLATLQPEEPDHQQRLQALEFAAQPHPTFSPLSTYEINHTFPVETIKPPTLEMVQDEVVGATNLGSTNYTGFGVSPKQDEEYVGTSNYGSTNYSGFGVVAKFQESGQFVLPDAETELHSRLQEAEGFITNGKINQAASILEKLVNEFPKKEDLRVKLKECFVKLGQYDKASDQCLALSHLFEKAGHKAQSQTMLAEAYQLLSGGEAQPPQASPQTSALPQEGRSQEVNFFFDPISGNYPKPGFVEVQPSHPQISSVEFNLSSSTASAPQKNWTVVPAPSFPLEMPTGEMPVPTGPPTLGTLVNSLYTEIETTPTEEEEEEPEEFGHPEPESKVSTQPLSSPLDSDKTPLESPPMGGEKPLHETIEIPSYQPAVTTELSETVEVPRFEPESDAEKPDFEYHYNLGLAFKGMDLFDEALRDFHSAYRSIKDNPQDDRYVPTCYMIGFCYMGQGQPKQAEYWFQHGLEVPNQPEEKYQALRFELGCAFEAQGKLEQALELFELIYANDISYRDVAHKIQEVEAKIKRSRG